MLEKELAIPCCNANKQVSLHVSSDPKPLLACLDQFNHRRAQIIGIRPGRKVLLKTSHVANPPNMVSRTRVIGKAVGDFVPAKFCDQFDSFEYRAITESGTTDIIRHPVSDCGRNARAFTKSLE